MFRGLGNACLSQFVQFVLAEPEFVLTHRSVCSAELTQAWIEREIEFVLSLFQLLLFHAPLQGDPCRVVY
jgi:hypothetical protein